LTANDAAEATALAEATGQPVEILPDRTDWSQTFAQPGGGFEASEALQPQRVQEPDGSWVALNAGLSVQPGGLVAPGAITTGLTLSDGGSGPLFTLSQGTESLSVSWPFGSLPVPSLSGATATYANVLPGVNLLVTATPTGVSDIIEVLSAAAAANPDLAALNFPISTAGLAVAADGAGNLTATDPSGNPVFSAPPALMWDSAVPSPVGVSTQVAPGAVGTGLPEAADGPMPGDHQAVMTAWASASSLNLTPVQSVLTGQAVIYPVFIDPSWNGDQSDGTAPTWSDVWKNGAGSPGGEWEFTDPLGGIRAGVYCSPDNNGNCQDSTPDSTYGIYRSYLNFPLPSGYAGSQPDYTDAQLQLQESWSWSCTHSELDLWQTDKATQGITWTSRPQQLSQIGTATTAHGWEPPGGGSSCPTAQVNLPAGQALQAAGASGYSANTVTLELRADDHDEANWTVNSWKRFQVSSVDLVFFWEHAPSAPSSYGTQGVFNPGTGQFYTDCATHQGGPDFVDVNNPTWQTWIDDPLDRQYDANPNNNNSAAQLDGEFNWQNLTTGASNSSPLPDPGNHRTLGPAANGNPAGAEFSVQRTGTPGDEYGWSAWGQTIATSTNIGSDTAPALSGPTSPTCYFMIDTTVPSGVVSVSGSANDKVGTPAQYTLTDPNFGSSDSNVVGFFYGIGAAGTGYVPATNGQATITLTPFTIQNMDLYVQAVSDAGRPGPLATGGAPSFVISPTTPTANIATMGYWRLNNNSMDTSGDGAYLTLQPGASYACGSGANPPGYTCSLSGEADTGRPVVSSESAYSVSAWVNMAGCSSYCVALSEDASHTSVFALAWQSGCQGNNGCWVYQMRASDNQSTTMQTATSQPLSQGSATNTWVQLTAVFNPDQVVGSEPVGTMTLYVNGTQAGQIYGISPWNSLPAGVARIGAGFAGANPWDGTVSDACVFYGPLASSDVTSLYAGGQADGCAALATTYP
jgi:hypothetical protein